jgi:HEAT repeat protein
MQKLMLAIGATICLSALVVPNLEVQEPISVPRLFELLQSENTTAEATAMFLELGPGNAEAKEYLAKRLPAIINQETKNYYVWGNCVRLAGAFRLKEAIPALVKSINAATAEGQTFATNARLDPFPCAKALVKIGDPAVPALTEVLEKGDWRHRWFAYRVMFLIGSRRSIGALRDHIDHESDQDLKSEIQMASSKR